MNRQLREIGGDFSQVASIYLIGANGDLLVSSRSYPAPVISISEREDFLAARAIRPHPYFSRFYRELTNGDASLALALYRADGNLLVRYPPWPGGVKAPAANAFAAALRDKQWSGYVRVKSPVDGVERLVAFRRVGDYPLYVSSAYATGAIVDAWRRHFIVIAALTAVPCIAIWILVLYSLRQLDGERVAWERWQGEVAMRLLAEASSRQLQRMGALGNLVANVAHDFNNLLMVVSANIELARLKRFNNLEKEMTAVQRATATAELLTRRLLSVAKKQPLKQEPIDLRKWMPGAAPLIEAALGDHIELALSIVDDVWQVLADPTDLELAIMNLAVNARDAMPGGGRFVIRCQNNRLVGSGTTVRLYLPRYRERRQIEAAAEEVAEQSALRHAGMVLLVEDNEDVAAGVAAVLQTFGCEVRHEPTADQAFDVLTGGERFEFVLSDIQMPGKLNGIDLAEKVRSTWPSQKIALMTGYADELERARRLGVAILAKPFNIAELHALVACES
ncbi:MAG: FOG: PAS/PAC domain [uncultured Paraburkholderia sp.]|nr:MAG: FOG: PAS/PAC domain [uncultured Paraburkholderia sp.]